MILSTAYALILGLSYQPQPAPAVPAYLATNPTVVRPSEPVSLAAGDTLGMALMASSSQQVPPLLASRVAIVAAAAPAWTVMPTDRRHVALGR